MPTRLTPISEQVNGSEHSGAEYVPVAVKARIFVYRFATREEKRRTGLVWIREPEGVLVNPASLRAA